MKTFSPTSPQQSFEDRLLEELLAMQASLNIPSPTRRLARWSGPRHVIAVGLAAAAAIVVALQVLPGSVNAPPAASAAGELEKLSSAALSGTPQILGPGQYVYTEEISNSGPPAHLGNDAYNVQWLGSQRLHLLQYDLPHAARPRGVGGPGPSRSPLGDVEIVQLWSGELWSDARQ